LLTSAVVLLHSSAFAQQSAHDRHLRITNGHNARQGQYPFVVALRTRVDDQPFCTGSLVASDWVLTADHCFEAVHRRFDLFYISTGTTPSNQKNYFVDKEVGFPSNTLDVHLLRLTRAADLAPVALATRDEIRELAAPGMTIRVVGWGWTVWDVRSPPARLQWTSMKVLGLTACGKAFNEPRLSSDLICAVSENYPEAGPTPNRGDSGSPYIARRQGGKWLQVGVHTQGLGPTDPAVGVRSAAIIDWVNSTIAEH
jgi:hypothetical protein